MVMMLDLQTEVEMNLPGRFKVSPQIAGAIKAVPAWSTCTRCTRG
jgi:DNA polymerase III subunit alpha